MAYRLWRKSETERETITQDGTFKGYIWKTKGGFWRGWRQGIGFGPFFSREKAVVFVLEDPASEVS